MKSMHKTIFIVVFLLAAANCKRTLQVTFPPGNLEDSKVLGNDSSTLDVITGVYYAMSGPSPIDGANSIYLEMGLAADELDEYYPDPILSPIYADNFSPAQPYFWDYLFQQIYACNAVINSRSVSQFATATPLRRQAIGEALFLRAFLFFYAINIYGNIPMPTTTNYQVNNVLTQSPRAAVYAQITSDLMTARGLLTLDYLDGSGNSTSDRVRPNKWAAMALLARADLYAGDWADAQSAADSVIADASQYTLLTDLNQVFLANSPEAIWQLPPVIQYVDTYAATIFLLTGAPNFQQTTAMDSFLVNAFEPGDLRLSSWVGADTTGGVIYYYPYKYKVAYSTLVKEYLMVMRLAEQYLIRAEAKTRQGDLMGAAADLNQLRSRAGLPATTATTQAQLLTAIAHERQVELFTEFGDRWFDLKRTGSLDSVMPLVEPHKGGVWNSYDSLFPIPASEIQLNPNLTQNPGY
jgi:hypothetical protein